MHDPASTDDDHFGFSVAVSGTYAIIGAHGTRSSAGAAYIFTRRASGWPTTPDVSLRDPANTAKDDFGFSVDISPTTAVVGAPFTSTTNRVAYVFEKGTSVWPVVPSAALHDPAATYPDGFGESVATDGTTVVIGAPGAASFAGTAYVFAKDTAGWIGTPAAALQDPRATSGDSFGQAVAVAGGVLGVGAYGTRSTSGAAYAFGKKKGAWSVTPAMTLDDPGSADDYFGFSISLVGSVLTVGSYGAAAHAGVALQYKV